MPMTVDCPNILAGEMGYYLIRERAGAADDADGTGDMDVACHNAHFGFAR